MPGDAALGDRTGSHMPMPISSTVQVEHGVTPGCRTVIEISATPEQTMLFIAGFAIIASFAIYHTRPGRSVRAARSPAGR